MTEQMTGTVFNIQRFSVHDGPGIRSIVFFKGCHLRCEWCSNPESQDWRAQLMFVQSDCMQCGQCVKACPHQAIAFNPSFSLNKEQCTLCGQCVEVCYSGALILEGYQATVPELIKELRKDAIQYRRSGGGITLSGGEALAQPDFCAQLLKACKEEGWHTAIETAAFVPRENIEKVLPYLDLVLMDIKHANSTKHTCYTGKPNEPILENAKLFDQADVELIIRVPVIPGFNDKVEEIIDIAKIAASLSSVKELHLLPFHRMGENKYQHLQYEYKMKGVVPIVSEKIIQLKETVEQATQLHCQIGG
ncbi:glycyl-radical enzyme activating protein [Neisseria sp. Ec49-e6-T10]|uniref:glycyl-radical enzyme activating protein n=1 Tax=Neisseria sp. Ec49-e6-T10 TaxID=3140744 RepID=UPI003EBD05F2